VASINGLVNEYTKVCSQVRSRFPMGVGRYLMNKLEASMLTQGVLEVQRVQGKKGNYVFINGRSVGLSGKLKDFSTLAVHMTVYSKTLGKLTASLKRVPVLSKSISVPPPQYEGH